MTAMLMRVALILTVLALIACDRVAPYDGLDEQERELVGKTCRDNYVKLVRTERRADGALLVVTRQGDETVRYEVRRPAADQDPVLVRLANMTSLDSAIEPVENREPASIHHR